MEEHLKEGRYLRKIRKHNPGKKIWDTHLNNAIAKYGEHIWKLSEIDIAYSKEELNEKETYWIKEYDSMNPKKGYNMTEGGERGKLRKEVKEKIRETIKRKFREDPEYRKKIGKKSKERMNNPQYKKKILPMLRIFLPYFKSPPILRLLHMWLPQF
jgi:hypothetical protein